MIAASTDGAFPEDILIVDDTPASLKLLVDILGSDGYRTRPASDGKLAMRSVQARLPALILLDIKMPGMDGYELCRLLKADERTRTVPIIFISVLGDEREKIKAFQVGGVDYISKPFHAEEVLARVKTHVTLRRAQAELEHRNAELRAAHDTLEERVRERSAELEESNRNLESAIRELKHAEKNAQDMLRFLQTVLDTIPHPIFYKDIDGIYRGCNKEYETFLGLKKEDIVGKSVYDVFPGDLADKYHEMDSALFRQPGRQVYEWEMFGADGSRYDVIFKKATYLNADGAPAGLVGVMVDITERKRAEEERARLATAVEQGADSTYITDPKGNIQYLNAAFERMTGYAREEVIGLDHRILRSGKHDKAFSRTMRAVLSRGEAWSGRLIGKKKDGAFYDVDVTISPVRDSKGDIINYVWAGRDVTYEARLERQLQQAQKMEAIGTLASGIAHDFNNILSASTGYAELALLKTQEGTRLHEYLKQILASTSRATELVNRILTFSRKSVMELHPVQVEHIAKEALKMLRAFLPTTIEIRQNIRSHSLVLADPTQIHQVLVNLCTNANHAMREKGGILEIALTDVVLGSDSMDESVAVEPGSYMKLTVRDTGCGMPPDVLERIFDPFFTTKAVGEGTGLGLSVVHGIVNSLGGDVTVSSEPEKGSVFHVFLPIIQRNTSSEPVRETVVPTGSERILFVDDEAAIAAMGKELLESLKYEVDSRTSPIDALEVFRAQPARFDLVITDQTMPNMTGVELSERLVEIRPDIPIILCSGYSPNLLEDKAGCPGIKALAPKPLARRDMARIIRDVLDENRVRTESRDSQPD